MAREPKGETVAIVEGAERTGVGRFQPLAEIGADVLAAPAVSIPVAEEARTAPPAVEVSADFVTAPRRVDEAGFELDDWGLPRVGPIRVACLAEMGRVDPNIDPAGWKRLSAPAAPQE